MLLQKLTVTNVRSDVLDLPLKGSSEGFEVKKIEGLGPVKATLSSSTFANMDGEQFHSARREIRNIVVKLGLAPNYAISSAYELRSKLYNFFMPKTQAHLSFTLFDRLEEDEEKQTIEREITGRIESFEPNIFSREPTVDLSLLCYEPAFIEPGKVIENAETISGETSLPRTDMVYEGTTETGVLIELTLNQATDRVRVFQTPFQQTPRTMVLDGDYISGDEIRINTALGNKFITVRRGGVTSSRLYDLTTSSAWVEFFPGSNLVSVNVDGAATPYTVEYLKKFGGL